MSAVEPSAAPRGGEEQEAFVGRLFEATLGMMDLFAMYLGQRLGYYHTLAEAESLTPIELAARTGTAERYAREWLEQQAVTGILAVDEAAADPAARRYRLPAAHAEVILNRDSLYHLGPVARFAGAFSNVVPALLQAYQTGGGVPWTAYGADGREAQADLNRPAFLNLLGQEWLPAIPDLHARLTAEPTARVADIGCGAGWSSIAIAQTYPTVRVDGFDVDDASIALARINAAQVGVADRVSFHVRDASDSALAGRYDLVTAFEMIHDLSRPVEVLRTIRGLLAEGGVAIVMDERVAETFAAPGDEVERFMYGASLLCCLPVGLSESPSAGTGTVMRPDTLRGYARQAGFADIDILPIEHDFFRFYRLVL